MQERLLEFCAQMPRTIEDLQREIGCGRSEIYRNTAKAIEFGIPRIRFHDLRHTFGTIAVQAFPLTDVKAFMGHADIQTTTLAARAVPRNPRLPGKKSAGGGT